MMQGIGLPRGRRMLIDACHPMVRPHLDLQAAGYMMLIDSKGIIRYKGSELAFASKLDSELEALVQEAETAAKSSESSKTDERN